MKSSEIKVYGTYMFVATDSESRKHLEGKPFKVVEIRAVWRRLFKRSKRVKRFFNENGEGARAEELEPMNEREFLCTECETGEYQMEGFVQPNGQTNYVCNECGHLVSFT